MDRTKIIALLIAIGLVYLVMLIWSGSLLNPLVHYRPA